MRRAVAEIVDPSPTDVGPVWDYFKDRCAYCDKWMKRDARIGHVDHAKAGGGNHLGNLVLACPECNGDAKRDEPWQHFLRRTVQDHDEASRREVRILAWFALHPKEELRHSGDAERVRTEIEQLISDFSAKCDKLRQMVHN
jgi:hypothetical protein